MTKITPTDIVKYISYIRINFENAYKTNTAEEQTILIKGWYNSLSKYPKEVVDVAVNKAVENSEFAPRLATIIKEIEKMQAAFEKSDGELWAELTGCLREVAKNVYAFRYNAIDYNGKTQGENARLRVKEIFDGLSPELKEYLRNPQGLIEIAEYTDDQLTYERGRFMRIMPEVKERAKTRQAMPESLTGIIQSLAVHLSFECVGTKQIEGAADNAKIRK